MKKAQLSKVSGLTRKEIQTQLKMSEATFFRLLKAGKIQRSMKPEYIAPKYQVTP